MNAVIRPIRPSEIPLLSDFLYEAIFVPKGQNPPPRDILRQPELQVYISNFGQYADDLCYVAEADGRIVGAVWTRIMNDYGHVDDQTPSLSISLYKEYRGQGIGTALLQTMLEALKAKGYRQVSLSVQKANETAVRMYKKAGFQVVKDKGEEFIMVGKV